MAYLFDDFQKFGKEHLEVVVTTSSSSLAKSWLAMRDSDKEWQIGETMAEVLRERLVELETLEATGAATEETVGRLAFVRKLLISGLMRGTQVRPRGQREHGARRRFLDSAGPASW